MDDIFNLNQNNNLDFLHQFDRLLNNNDLQDNPYLNIQLNSNYHDQNSILQIPNILNSPVYLSLNTQSLNSKFENLKQFVLELVSQNVNIEVRTQ